MSIFLPFSRTAVLFLAVSSGLCFAEDQKDLEPASASIEEITIIGSVENAQQIPGAAQFLSPERLGAFNHTDVQKVLREVPGVSLQIEDGFGLRPNISIRGVATERSSRITLLEDNILIAPAPYSAPSAYYFPTMGRMHAVEVIKGPAAISQGPYTIGGALNLVSTPIAQDPQLNFLAETGSDATHRARVALHQNIGSRGKFMLESHLWRSDGFQAIRGSQQDTGLTLDDYTGKFELGSKDGRHKLSLKLQTTEQQSHQSYLGLTDQDFRDAPLHRYGISELDTIDTDHQQQVLRYVYQPAEATRLDVAMYNNTHKRNWFKTERYDADGSSAADTFSGQSWNTVIDQINQDTTGEATDLQQVLRGALDTPMGSLLMRANAREYFSRGVQLALQHDFSSMGFEQSIEAGLRFHEDGEDRLQRDSTYHQADGLLHLDDLGVWGNAGNRKQTAKAIAAYIQHNIEFDRLILSPGVRFENIDQSRQRWETRPGRTIDPASRELSNLRDTRENQSNITLPGIGLLWSLTDRTRLIGGAHKGFTTPSNQPGVRPETAMNYELGLRHAGDIELEAIYFLSDYDNLLGQCTASSGVDCMPGDSFNGDAATIRGLEVMLHKDIATQQGSIIGATLNFTRIDGRFDTNIADTAFFGDVNRGDPIPYLPRHQVHLGLSLLTAQWSHYVDLTYQDAVCVRASCLASEQTEAQFSLDLSSQFAFNESLTLLFKVDNVTDQIDLVARQPYGARPNRGRAVHVGVEISI